MMGDEWYKSRLGILIICEKAGEKSLLLLSATFTRKTAIEGEVYTLSNVLIGNMNTDVE